MSLRGLAEVRDLFSSLKGNLVGVGMTAYSRIIPAEFLPSYQIIALRMTQDLAAIRKKTRVFCLEEEMGARAEEGFNSARLLSHPLTKTLLRKIPDPKYLLLYQSYPELEALAKKEGWVLLANPASLRMQLDERGFFRRMADALGLDRLTAQEYPVREIHDRNYQYWSGKVGSEFVVHLPEIRQGGGKGTFFVHTFRDYRGLRAKLKGRVWRGHRITRVSIEKFVEGIAVSLALCLTRHGMLFSGLQRQLIDLPHCKGISENGVFCGHSWGDSPWSDSIKDEAKRQAKQIGSYLGRLGYKGILGIDFLVTKDGKHIYPLECNPRLTGAFPMLSQLHLQNEAIPMDVFHILEFLGTPYHMDPLFLNDRYARTVRGSHIILFRLQNEILTGGRPLLAGLYEFSPEEEAFSFKKEAIDYRDFRNNQQFILTEGPLDSVCKNRAFMDPLERMGRVLFPYPVIDRQQHLSSKAMSVAQWVYKRMFQ
jgi:hypothetical protein